MSRRSEVAYLHARAVKALCVKHRAEANELQATIAHLRAQLDEAREALEAIAGGNVACKEWIDAHGIYRFPFGYGQAVARAALERLAQEGTDE